ncbi:MAG: hypothetical protein Kow0098_08450 [Ignavibacteriaceae bacterium]
MFIFLLNKNFLSQIYDELKFYTNQLFNTSNNRIAVWIKLIYENLYRSINFSPGILKIVPVKEILFKMIINYMIFLQFNKLKVDRR